MNQINSAEEIRETPLFEALSERYLSYALSTIMSRSLPDVRDGLKPVHRRLLFAMRQLKLDPETGFKKCARVVGDVIGKYHPHGDASVYDALVRLAQEFAQRYPLVDGQGNFGNIDGDNAAAMRYTESRMTPVAKALLEGIEENAVDFRETYDGEEKEPLILPARFPNLLANGATGIAVGMATNIPPHNVSELCDALSHLIKFPNVRFEKLIDLIPGPDFPTGGVLVETRENILEAYKTGRGGFRLRARWEEEKLAHGQYQIVVTEIPYQIQKSRLIEKIADLLNSRKLPMLNDIRDESAEDIRIVLEPKNRTVDPEFLMEHLFRQTDFEIRFGLNMNVLDIYNTPRVMDLREILQAFLDHRHDVLIRQTKHRLEKIKNRLEVLGGLLTAYLNLDEVIRIIREYDDAKKRLINSFKLTEIQADAILNMRLRQLRKLEQIQIKNENKELTAEKKSLDDLLKNEKKSWKTITSEIANIKKQFGQKTDLGKRRTSIEDAPTGIVVPLEAMIEKEPVTLIYSEKGWVRSIKGHLNDTSSLKFKDGDRLRFAIKAETIDKLIVFATNGRFYTIGVDRLPGGRGHGEPIRLLADLPNDSDIIEAFIFQGDRKILIASDGGRGFIIDESDVIGQTKNGKQVLNLKPNQEAHGLCFIGDNHTHVAVIGTQKKLLIFPLEDLPEMSRGSGVILQKYSQGGLSDMKTLDLKEGLSWTTAAGVRTEKNVQKWVGKRAQAGQFPFKGFPKSCRFN